MSATEPRVLGFDKYRSWVWKICDINANEQYYGIAEVATFEDDRLALIGPYTTLPHYRQAVYLAYGRKQILDITDYSYRQLFDTLSVILAATSYRESPDILDCILLANKDFQKNHSSE